MLLQWAGSKRSIASQILQYFPSVCNNYFEPFVGTGVIFQKYALHIQKQAYLSDSNPHLIALYQAIKEQPQQLIDLVSQMPNTKNFFTIYANSLPLLS